MTLIDQLKEIEKSTPRQMPEDWNPELRLVGSYQHEELGFIVEPSQLSLNGDAIPLCRALRLSLWHLAELKRLGYPHPLHPAEVAR